MLNVSVLPNVVDPQCCNGRIIKDPSVQWTGIIESEIDGGGRISSPAATCEQ